MLNKRLIAMLLTVVFILTLCSFTVSADDSMDILSFNATMTTVVVDLDTDNEILSDSIGKKVTLFEHQKGEYIEVNSSVKVTKNTLIITPNGGLEEGKYYYVEIDDGVLDSEGNSVSGTLRTNWFNVEEVFTEDFNAKFDNEMKPISPYYYEVRNDDRKYLKHEDWIVDSSLRNAITVPGSSSQFAAENGLDTVMAFNNGGYAVLNNENLPEEYTVEYTYNFPLSYTYAGTAYGSHRMRVGAPAAGNRSKGIGVKFGSDHNNSKHTSTIELVADGYSGDLSAYKYNEYNFGSETIRARMSVVDNHFQWFSDNVKLFDLYNVPDGNGTIAFIDGVWPDQTLPYIDDIVISRCIDKGENLPVLKIESCTAAEDRVSIEFSDEIDENTVRSSVSVFKEGVKTNDYSINVSDYFVYIDLPVSEENYYRIDIDKKICSKDGFGLNEAYQFAFEVIDNTLISKEIEKPEIKNVTINLLNNTKQIEVLYDFISDNAERTKYEISTSISKDGVYTLAYEGNTINSTITVGDKDIFKDKYIKIILYPIDNLGYIGDLYTQTEIPGFMSPVVSDVKVSGKVEDGSLNVEYEFYDENGDEDISEIIWMSSDFPDGEYVSIANENDVTLEIDKADELFDKFIKVKVVAKSSNYPDTGNTIISDVISRVFKPEARNVKIIGESTIGKKVTPYYEYFDYNGMSEVGTTWVWMIANEEDGEYEEIGTLNQEYYEITEDEIGKYLKLCIIPGKEGTLGEPTYSKPFVLPAPPKAENVSVSGTVEAGHTVVGKYDYFQAGGVKEKNSSYAWYLDDKVVSTNKNYTIKKDDVGKKISFEVIPKSEKEPMEGIAVRSEEIKIKDLSSGDGGKRNNGSGGRGGSSGGISVSKVDKIENDMNEAATLVQQNSSEYITPFTDIKDSDYIKEIVYLSDLDIINGTSATTFEPERDITRAEIAALICRALNFKPSNKNVVYLDVKDDAWYFEYVNAITEQGFMCGYDNIFRPDDVITYEEIIKVMTLVYESKFGVIDAYEGTEVPKDASEWSCGYLKKAIELSWYKNANEIKPLKNAIRQDAAYLLYNALGIQK